MRTHIPVWPWLVVALALGAPAALAGAAGGAQADAQNLYRVLVVSGTLMMTVGLGSALLWRWWAEVTLRWFWAGAGIWTLGVLLKFAAAFALNRIVLRGLQTSFPQPVYWALGALYLGLLTGVFEVGVTLLVARTWPRMAQTEERAVAVGLGAGGLEALMLGLSALASAMVIQSGVAGAAQAGAGLAAVAHTPLPWLVGPTERVMALLCHTASRSLVLMGVAVGRWSFFWYGFLLLTGLDAVAAAFHLSGALTRMNMWWVELGVLPFAAVSLLAVRWCLRNWSGAGEGAWFLDAG